MMPIANKDISRLIKKTNIIELGQKRKISESFRLLKRSYSLP